MMKMIIPCLVIVLIIVGCQNKYIMDEALPKQTASSNKNQATTETAIIDITEIRTIETEALKPSATAIQINPITTEQDPKPTKHMPKINDIDIHENGILWVYDNFEKKYLKIDLNTMDSVYSMHNRNDCFGNPLPNSTSVICKGSVNLFLLDLSNQHRDELPVSNPDRLYRLPWIQNERFIIFGYWINSDQRLNLYSYDLISNEQKLIAQNMPDGEYYISSDGTRVLTEYNNEIIDILSKPVENLLSNEYSDLIYNPFSIIWSPQSNKVFIGASDTHSDVFSVINKYFIVDIDSKNIIKVNISPDILRNAMLGSYWSPDGSRIAIGGGPELCIYFLDEVYTECIAIDQSALGNEISSIAWSPNSRYIAFSYNNTIYIYDNETQKNASLIENIFTTEIFWR